MTPKLRENLVILGARELQWSLESPVRRHGTIEFLEESDENTL
jgi:hypothetical protein